MTDYPLQFSWLLHLFDIVLVAVVVYHLLLLLKGGGMAPRLLFWFAAGFSVYLCARLVGLDTLSWILGDFFSVSLLLLAIIFQHDIRRAMVHFSKQQHRILARHEEIAELIDEIASAVESLALKKIGALIVVERGMPLDNFLSIGTDIDAKVTSELISSIFLPYSPIHDGAVIIQGEKLTKAGCFLPLSQNTEIEKSFGTRHRAALGLSEIVDALVVVVSEETGRVALASNGKLLQNLELGAVRKELKRQLGARRSG